MTGKPAYRVTVHNSITEIGKANWDACANPKANQSDGDYATNPFTSYDFLEALELSGSAVNETGWAARHICVATEDDDEIIGVMPMYLKSHSQGEYVFDYAWADAYSRAGGQYYPKLQASVPFTPATGRRLLAKPGPDQHDVEQALLAGAVEVTNQTGTSSLHFTFLPKDQWAMMGDVGLLQRTDQQFHWLNDDYESFEDFLGDLTSRKRKTLRKEREAAVRNDIEIESLTGDDLKDEHFDAFFDFYMDTSMRKWGRPYLTREFFARIQDSMTNETLLILCKRHGRYIAGAINFIGSDTLFGRNWGCIEDHRFLHFETCYYRAIDFAIERGLKRVEAGAQGGHKLARGYVPTLTYSAHYLPDARFRKAVADYLEHERAHVAEDHSYLETRTPFRQGEPQPRKKENTDGL